MTQATPIIGAGQSGIQYRTQDNDGKKALLNHHKGSTAPTYIEAGMIWLDDSATPWILKIYDGTDWIVVASVNATTNAVETYHGTAALRLLNHATDTGTANAYAVAPVPSTTAYVTGQIVTLKPVNASTGAATINVSGLGVKNIKILAGGDPASGALATSGVYTLVYDGTNFVLLNPSLGSAAYLTAGTSALNLVQLNGSAQLPAVSGALLTNLPVGSSTLVLISSATASASATLDFTSGITSAYSNIMFILHDISPSGTLVSFQMLTSINAGSTWDASYRYGTFFTSYAANGSAGVDGAAAISLTALANTISTGGIPINALVNWFDLSVSGNKRCTYDVAYRANGGTAGEQRVIGHAFNIATTNAITGIRFQFSSGNITSGKIFMYGVKNT